MGKPRPSHRPDKEALVGAGGTQGQGGQGIGEQG